VQNAQANSDTELNFKPCGKRRGVSIIVPLLNEFAVINDLIEHLSSLNADEIIIVDGGSNDGTRRAVLAAGFRLIDSEAGRAYQMNAGAASAQYDVLFFLHADTRRPTTYLSEVQQAQMWGRFDVRFDTASLAMQTIARFMNTRSRITSVVTGDQALFVRAEAFAAIGGFPLIPLMEDVAISKILRKLHAPYCSQAQVITSARRWQKHGVVKTVLKMWWFRLAYFMGISPQTLKRGYQDVR